MKRMFRHPAVWIVVLVLASGCNPLSPSQVSGDWAGRDAPAHFAWINIRFTAAGSGVEGRACRYDGPYLTFMDAPVHLDGRRVTITVTVNGITRVFEGEFDEDGEEIVGSWTNTHPSPVTFTRGGSYCSHAKWFGT
jgi:hypothetical protein